MLQDSCRWRVFSFSQSRGQCIRSLNKRLTPHCSSANSDIRTETCLPRSKIEIIEQAHKAVLSAWKDGVKRQRLDVLLPLIGATEIDDWPGGVRQEFKAAKPMMEDLLKRLKQEDALQGALAAEIWDQGDAVACWRSRSLALILFLTGDTLREAKGVAKELSDGLCLMVNPQWQAGQLLSDFGFGPWRKNNEEFVNSFQSTYTLKRLRLLKQYPGKWNIYLTDVAGKDTCIGAQASEPSYKDLQALLRGVPSSNSSKSLADRLQAEFAFNRDSLK